MEQNRFKSPVLWASLAAQVLSMLVLLDVITLPMSDAIEGVVAALLQLLACFGVVNNPTDSKHI